MVVKKVVNHVRPFYKPERITALAELQTNWIRPQHAGQALGNREPIETSQRWHFRHRAEIRHFGRSTN